MEGKRGVCVWHRRAGKDLLAINLIATKVFKRRGLYWHLLPTYRQGRNIVWNGFTRDGRPFLDHFPKEIVTKKLDNEMRIHFVNGSIYQVVGTDNVDTLVGTNPVGVVLSEYSLHDPTAWDYLSPILRENGGWALFIMTFRGKNHGYRLYQMAKDNPDWFSDLRIAGDHGTKRDDDRPVVSDEEINMERASGRSEAIIQQEYYCNPEGGMEGSYYGTLMMEASKGGRLTGVPYEPLMKVDTFWDLGMRDATAIIFAQRYGWEIRIIDYYENSGEPLRHYRDVLERKGYNYGNHYAPWDVNVRELTSGRTRLETAREMGLRLVVTPQHDVNDGIENVRNVLPLCWFDKVKTERLIDALNTYRKEPEEEKRWSDPNHPLFKDRPLHDWSSHGADAMRYMAWHYRKRKDSRKRNQDVAIDEYAYI